MLSFLLLFRIERGRLDEAKIAPRRSLLFRFLRRERRRSHLIIRHICIVTRARLFQRLQLSSSLLQLLVREFHLWICAAKRNAP